MTAKEEEKPAPFLTTPVSILIGSAVIALSILISGGVVKLKSTEASVSSTTAPSPTTQAAQVPQQPQAASLSAVKDAFSKSVIKFGNTDSKLLILEVADPSCPYCSAATGENPTLNKQMGPNFTLPADGGSYQPPVSELAKLAKAGKAAFAYIYFPGHGNGEMGAKALYCAFENNKFWEVHDKIMGADGYNLLNSDVKNDNSKSGKLSDFLSSVVDPIVMKNCLDNGKYNTKLQSDTSLASGLNVNGTPSFYLNDKLFPGAVSFTDMQTAIKNLNL